MVYSVQLLFSGISILCMGGGVGCAYLYACMSMSFCMQGVLQPVTLHRHPQVKQLPHIKQSNWVWLKYHGHVIVPMFVLLEPNLPTLSTRSRRIEDMLSSSGGPPSVPCKSDTQLGWRQAVAGLYSLDWEMGFNGWQMRRVEEGRWLKACSERPRRYGII